MPLKTPNLGEAIQYQLSVLVPFPEDSFHYSYSAKRQGGTYQISLYAVQRQLIDMYLQDIVKAGYTVTGLFPETQRYISGSTKKMRWGLFTPGHYAKLTILSNTRVEERVQCTSDAASDQLQELCGCEAIYHFNPAPGSEFLNAANLLRQKPLLKEYNMLPASYRRPDYYKMIISALVVLNLVALLGLTGIKVYSLHAASGQVQAEIDKIKPQVNEVKEKKKKQEELSAAIEQIESIGTNPDLIGLLTKITKNLPKSSYLDQVRLDEQTGDMQIQGFTDDIGDLTTNLQTLGDITLKSTSRRKNQTYFQLELNLP